MNIFTNEGQLKTQISRAKRLQRLGIAFLAVSFLVSCGPVAGIPIDPWVVLAAYPFLLLGFPIFTLGNNRLKLLRRLPQADLLINAELKGLNNKYSLHHYVPLGSIIVDHLLLGPGGALVFESRDSSGEVSCRNTQSGDRWSQKRGLMQRLVLGQLQVGNPTRDLDNAIGEVKKVLAGAGKSEVPVRGLVLFTQSREISQEGCTFPAVPLEELKQAVKDNLTEMESGRSGAVELGRILTTDDRRRINAMLVPPSAAPAPRTASAARSR